MIKLSGYTTNYGEDPECLSAWLDSWRSNLSPKYNKKTLHGN